MLYCKIEVGNCLSLYSLGGIHDQQRPFTGSDGPGNLIGEVHVARSVNQIEDIFLILVNIVHLNGVALYGYAFLPFEVHRVEHLVLHFTGRQGVGDFEHPVGQGALAMVDMGYYAEIADFVHCCQKSLLTCAYTFSAV